MAKKWIKAAVGKNPGALRRNLDVKPDEKIPAAKLAAAKHSENPKIRAEANLAETLKGFHKPPRARKAMYGGK